MKSDHKICFINMKKMYDACLFCHFYVASNITNYTLEKENNFFKKLQKVIKKLFQVY